MVMASLDSLQRQLLTELVMEFAWRVDHQRAATIHELVSGDVEIRLANSTMLNKEDVVKWGVERDAVKRATCHLMTNVHFEVAEDGTVIGSSTALIFRYDGDGVGPAHPWAVTEYRDVFVREGGEWKFASRVSKDLFFSPEAASSAVVTAVPREART